MKKASFNKGVKAMTPLLAGVIPFALITGITAAQYGLSMTMNMFMSLIVFAGAAQLAALQLIGEGASSVIVVYTALIINFRFLMYSLSIAPYFKDENIKTKGFLAYIMSDQSYALSMVHFMNEEEADPKSYYAGASLTLWLTWQSFTVIGYSLGAAVPASWGLDFAVPLTFMAILLKSVHDVPMFGTMVVSGLVSVMAFRLPMNGGLVLSAFAGIAGGLLFEWMKDQHKGEAL